MRREVKSKQKKLDSMFMNYQVLDKVLVSNMRKFGLRPSGTGPTQVDPEILLLISDAMKIKYT